MEKFKEKYYSNIESIFSKQHSLEFSIQQISKQLSEFETYDDSEINNKIELLMENINSIKIPNYDEAIQELRCQVSSIKNINTQCDNLSKQYSSLKIPDYSGEIAELSKKILEIQLPPDLSLEINTLKNNISNIDTYGKKHIDNMFSSFITQLEKLSNISEKIILESSEIDKDLQETKEHWRVDGEDLYHFVHDEIDSIQKVCDSVTLLLDKVCEEHTILFEKLQTSVAQLEDSHNTLSDSTRTLENKFNTFTLPISIKSNLAPFLFVSSDCDIYSFSNTKEPIGISDKNGDIVIRGIAKLKYAGKVEIGNFIFGNKEGIGEKYHTGYIVTKILDNNFCEVLL